MESIRINAKTGYAVVSTGAKQNNVQVGVARRVTNYKGVSIDASNPGSGYLDLTPLAALELVTAILKAVNETLPEGQVVVRSLHKGKAPFCILDMKADTLQAPGAPTLDLCL